MESRARPEETLSNTSSPIAWRFRLVTCCVMLTALAFVQQPGRIVGDTKADLVLDPGGFLARVSQLWDPNGAFGQVQNQAYGYLFPMGPFFWLGHVVGMPPWVIQRLWWSLIFVVAFLGMVKLCSVLGLGSPLVRIVGGFAFALSPRMLSVIGPSSIEVWPTALAPWVLIPLVIGIRRGNPKRMAAFSALAVACVGGVNAAATFAVIPLGVVWLVLARPSSRRRQLMVFWPAFVLLGTLWWLIPLFLLGSVSPPFLDYIESASTTTFAANLFDAFRGTTNWLPYLDSNSVAGNALVRNGTFILNSVVVLTLGVVGIARKDNPHRRFLFSALLVGLVLVTLGHSGSGAGSAHLQGLLDGILAPLRNTHKFDPIIRVSLILGMVHCASVIGSRRGGPKAVSATAAPGVVLLACAAVLGSTVPAWTAELPNLGSYTSIPDYWHQSANWLNQHAEASNTLLLPGSAFGDYLWGSPRDEPLQALGRTPWSVRNAIPLTPAGNIRNLDALESAFASGRGSSSLEGFLERSGIGFLVVRNDLSEAGSPVDPEWVYSTIAGLPGAKSVAQFGPKVGSPATQKTDTGETLFVNHGLQTRHPAVEIFKLGAGNAAEADSQSAAKTPVVIGSPAALQLLGGSISSGTAALLAGDVPADLRPGNVSLTDTNRRQEVAFGRVFDNRSASLATSDPYRVARPIHDYEMPGGARWKTLPVLEGAVRMSASSSQSDVKAVTIDQTKQPWSAFDGDPATAWAPDPAAGDPRDWLEIDFKTARSVSGLILAIPQGHAETEVTVSTSAGHRTTTVTAGARTVVTAPAGLTRRLRISAPKNGFQPFSLSTVEVPGLDLARPLRMPDLPAAWGTPSEILMSAPDGPAPCLDVDSIARCLPSRTGLGEDANTIDRIFSLNAARDYGTALRVIPREDAAVAPLFADGIAVTPSSTAGGATAVGILAARDGDPQTGWTSDLKDITPTLRVKVDKPRRWTSINLTSDPTLAASAPKKATIRFDNGITRSVRFDLAGHARFKAVTSRGFRLRITDAYVRSNLSFDGTGSGLPIGFSEMSFGEPASVRRASAQTPRRLPCGSGPTVTIDGQPTSTKMTASLNDVVRGNRIVATLCAGGPVALGAGNHRVTVSASKAFRAQELQMGDANSRAPLGTPAESGKRESAAFNLTSGSGPGRQLLSVHTNTNPGWTAGDTAQPITVNGWMQGWLVPPDTTVKALFGLSGIYRGGLAVGMLALLVLIVFAVRLRGVGAPSSMTADSEGHPRVRMAAGVVGVLGSAYLFGSGWGILVAVSVAGAAVTWQRKWPLEWLAGLATGVAGIAYVLHPWGNFGEWAGAQLWPQLVLVASLSVCAVATLERPMVIFRRRIRGSSTSR